MSTAELTLNPPSRRVLDAATRASHWLMALCFAGAWLTAEEDGWRAVHSSLGYTLLGLLGFRLIWGVVGPGHARLGGLLRRAGGVKAWLAALKSGQAGLGAGYTALNAAAVLAILLLLALTVGSGIGGYNLAQTEAGADALGELHEGVANGLLLVVLAHIALVIGGAVFAGSNRLRAMLTGRVAGAGPDLAKRQYGVLAGLIIAAVLGFWGWQLAAGEQRIGREGSGAQAAFHKSGHAGEGGERRRDHDDDD